LRTAYGKRTVLGQRKEVDLLEQIIAAAKGPAPAPATIDKVIISNG